MLTVDHLHKRFTRSAPPALDGVSFEVRKGEIFGLLGHNGAGKSTAIGIMLGMVSPDAGDVTVGGVSVRRDRPGVLRQLGAIFESPRFYEYLSGWRNLKVLTAFSGGVPRREMEEIVAWVGLEKRIHHKVGTYSHGMRQRLALAQALLPRPKVLILDEPTDGLDPEGIAEFRQRVRDLRRDFGVTILLSSHLLAEVEQVCDRVAILQGGRKVYDGAGRGLGGDRALYRFAAGDTDALVAAAERFGGRIEDGCRLSLPKSADPAEVLAALVAEGARVREFARMEETLEDLYLKVSRSAESLRRTFSEPRGEGGKGGGR